MFGKIRLSRWLIGAALLAVAECASVVALEVALTAPVQAQSRYDQDRYPFLRRQRPQRSGGFFDQLFGPFNSRPRQSESRSQQQPTDYSRAPAPRKPDAKAEPVVPTTSIVVMGDGMADWLAYGLEDAFSDSPEIGIVRKNKRRSGLLRYEAKGDLDWWHMARDILAQEKADYVIMMLGVSDRQNIREKDLVKEAEKKAKDQQDKNAADKSAQTSDQADNTEQSSAVPPEPQRGRKANGVIEFRSDEWAKIYSRRIDETIAALKSKGVPVFWVGLPSIRGTRSTADAVYLNDLYRTRAERAGIVYIDVWDGFVDEAGKYSSYGPDYEGQTRRLRSGDGVFFTKYGARKLAHYVEREIRRYMVNRVTTLTFPTGPMGPGPGAGKSAVRPLAGPVLPLTTITSTSDVLLGGAGMRPARSDAVASGVLVKGDAVSAPPGRADDFKWPPDSQDYGKPPPPPPAANKPAKIGPAAAAPMTLTPAVTKPQTQASAPPAAVPLGPAPAVRQAAEPGKSTADAARAKAQAEAKKQAEARRRAAERARAEAQRSAEARTNQRDGLRPPARIETRRQPQRRPQRRSNDPLGELFGLLPR